MYFHLHKERSKQKFLNYLRIRIDIHEAKVFNCSSAEDKWITCPKKHGTNKKVCSNKTMKSLSIWNRQTTDVSRDRQWLRLIQASRSLSQKKFANSVFAHLLKQKRTHASWRTGSMNLANLWICCFQVNLCDSEYLPHNCVKL